MQDMSMAKAVVLTGRRGHDWCSELDLTAFAGAGDGEFRSIRRPVPRFLLRSLATVTLLYGAVIALVIPWNVYAAFTSESFDIFGLLFGVIGFCLMLRLLVCDAMAMRGHELVRYDTPIVSHEQPLVSILVPAYNEEETIGSALHSITRLDYPLYEVIVVDDGSEDKTYARAISFAGNHGRCSVRVFKKPNAGKWSALNLAFAKARGDFLLCVDADSRLSRNALRVMVGRCQEPDVSAVSGQVTIRNRHNLLSRLQAFEYVTTNGVLRAALGCLRLVTLVPGPIGLFRRDAMEAVMRLPCNQRP